MNKDSIAIIVAQRLRRYEGISYELFAWCIMPNHVHVVVRPLTKELHKIVEDWKGVSARKANRALKRSGIFWQEEYFDHLVRNEEDFEKSIEYVWKNPEEAGLRDWKWRWKAEGY